jgi:UDP:flavonoid glycosyltransferase YjiC (YdhE family)
VRFLFVVAPLEGHAAPLRAVASRLRAKGHEVAWAGVGEWLRLRVGSDATVFDCAPARFGDASIRPADVHGAAALKFLVDGYLVPLATAMLPSTVDAIGRFRPDVVVADQQTYAGACAAHLTGVPWATSASTSAELVDPYPGPIADWVAARLSTIWPSPSDGPDPRWSPWLVLAYSTPELAGPVDGPHPVRWVGPALPRADDGWTPPWPSARPVVLVTLGTANGPAGARFLRACADALAARTDLNTLILDRDGVLGADAAVQTARRVPQLAVLRQTSLVICHGGHNTVCESLWHGIPLIVAPIRDDQPVIAGQVEAAGAGVRIRFARAGAAQVATAVDTVLGNPAYASAAVRIADSFRAAGGADSAADALLDLAVRVEAAVV